MGWPFQDPGRVARGVLWRLARRTQVNILSAPPAAFEAPGVAGCALVRINADAGAADRDLAEAAMLMAGEPAGLVHVRLTHGHELFGWRSGRRIVSFGWVTYQDRCVGPIRLADSPGRAFLYNFFTDEGYRGRGLAPALQDAIRWMLGREGVTELLTDVNVRNVASTRAMEKAGFVPVARVAFLTILNRWRVPLRQTAVSDRGRRLLQRS